VALARALARRPKLMLLDEPFSALDPGLRSSTREQVATLLAKAGITTLLVTHDQEEALSFADQVALLREGRLHQVGTPQDLYLHPIDASAALFFGDAVLLDATIENGQALCCLGSLPIFERPQREAKSIMIRPKQLVLQRVEGESSGHLGEGVLAIVDSVAFGGAVSAIVLRILDDRNRSHHISLKYTGATELRGGDFVSVSVHGRAHPLPAP
jgi:iron(III) transport system ATP-binding protein